MISSRAAGLAFALAAPLLSSVGGVVFRSVEAGPWEAVFWRALGHAGPFALALALIAGTRALAEFRRAGWVAWAIAVLMATSFVAHVLAITSTTVANVLVVQSVAPVFVAILAWAWLDERLDPRGWLAIMVIFLGLAAVFGASAGGGRLGGDALALTVAATSAAAEVLLRRYRAIDLMPATVLAAILTVATALAFARPLSVTPGDAALLMALGLVQISLALGCVLAALRRLPVVQVSLISLLEPVLGPLWVWLFVGEQPPVLTLVGGTVVIGTLAVHGAFELRAGRAAALARVTPA